MCLRGCVSLRAAAVVLLGGTFADLMRDVFSLERDPAILAAALRLLPDVYLS